MIEQTQLIFLALGALLLSFVLLLAWRALEARWQRWRRRRTARRAQRGEQRAVNMLRDLGFVIEEAQPLALWPVFVGERCCEVSLRADYLVRRGSERFVAEVKTGGLVASVSHGPTRRQLLEYRCAYSVDGVVLVDVLAGAVLSVRFPGLEG